MHADSPARLAQGPTATAALEKELREEISALKKEVQQLQFMRTTVPAALLDLRSEVVELRATVEKQTQLLVAHKLQV